MSVGNNFKLTEEKRNEFIDEVILSALPEDKREDAKETIDRLAHRYIGVDLAAISLLAYAAQAEKFDKYVQKLDQHYEESLQFVHPEARKYSEVPGAKKAYEFFQQCYAELGIEVP